MRKMKDLSLNIDEICPMLQFAARQMDGRTDQKLNAPGLSLRGNEIANDCFLAKSSVDRSKNHRFFEYDL
jgi:hypothetical protein